MSFHYGSCNYHCSSKTIVCMLSILMILLAVFILIVVIPVAGLNGIQAQLIGAGGTIIVDGDNVVFDTLLNDQSDNISYDDVSGEFLITRAGNYYVDWWVGTDGAGPGINVTFTIEVDGVPYSSASSPIVSGQLSGEALVTVDTAPAVITLVNASTEDVFVPTTPIQANIVITEVVNN